MSYASDLQQPVGQIVTVGTGTGTLDGTVTAVDEKDDRLRLSVAGRDADSRISQITCVWRQI